MPTSKPPRARTRARRSGCCHSPPRRLVAAGLGSTRYPQAQAEAAAGDPKQAGSLPVAA